MVTKRMWPCGGGWTRGNELRGHGILCILNGDSKVTQDDGRTLHGGENNGVPEAACRVEKMLNSPLCGF